jgi:hypothetical protein
MIMTGINHEYIFYYSGMEAGVYPNVIVTSGYTFSGVIVSGTAMIANFDGYNIQRWYCEYLRDILYQAYLKLE